jgi:hypothetical protein
MANVPLHEFIGVYRDDLIRRCEAKVARTLSAPSKAGIDHGIPLFLDQLVQELWEGSSQTHQITQGAAEHGRALFLKGFTVSQVVHDYGAVCQAITDLAVEKNAPIITEDFRTMNRCLDDAIASAVTEHSRRNATSRAGESDEVHTLANAAIAAFEVILTGSVGVTGSTGGVLHRSLLAIRALGLMAQPHASVRDDMITEEPYAEVSRRLKQRHLVDIAGSPFSLSLINIRKIRPVEESRVSILVVAESPTTDTQHAVILTATADLLRSDPDQFIERAIQAMRNIARGDLTPDAGTVCLTEQTPDGLAEIPVDADTTY